MCSNEHERDVVWAECIRKGSNNGHAAVCDTLGVGHEGGARGVLSEDDHGAGKGMERKPDDAAFEQLLDAAGGDFARGWRGCAFDGDVGGDRGVWVALPHDMAVVGDSNVGE